MAYQHEALNLTCNEVGTNLYVDHSTVSRTVQLFRRTGHVSKKQYDTSNLPRQLTEAILNSFAPNSSGLTWSNATRDHS